MASEVTNNIEVYGIMLQLHSSNQDQTTLKCNP